MISLLHARHLLLIPRSFGASVARVAADNKFACVNESQLSISKTTFFVYLCHRRNMPSPSEGATWNMSKCMLKLLMVPLPSSATPADVRLSTNLNFDVGTGFVSSHFSHNFNWPQGQCHRFMLNVHWPKLNLLVRHFVISNQMTLTFIVLSTAIGNLRANERRKTEIVEWIDKQS